MKRILFEVVLALAVAGASAFGFMQWKGLSSSTSTIEKAKAEVESAALKVKSAEEKAKNAEQEIKALSEKIAPLENQSMQLESAKAAFSNGTLLSDVEALYKKEKSLSIERQLSLGSLRALTKGSNSPEAIEAFAKALIMSDWKTRKNTICAAQMGLASAGQKVQVFSGCNENADSHGAKDAHAANDSHGAKDMHAPKAGAAHAAPHWDYEGAMGPENWGKEFPTCSKGKAQSPLDIKGPFAKVRYSVNPDYKSGPLNIVNNGHTIQVNVPTGSKIRIDGIAYDLLQFHFHRPSEELVDGKPAAMVIHFVHKSPDGKLAVLGVLLEEGNDNPNIKVLWQHAPRREGPAVAVPNVMFNPGDLLPRDRNFWSYGGSLTTPPCTEGVNFYILKSKINISRPQLVQFPFKRNARPVQALNGRTIMSN